jgi:hypothetical protein
LGAVNETYLPADRFGGAHALPKQLLCIVLDDAVPNEEQQH